MCAAVCSVNRHLLHTSRGARMSTLANRRRLLLGADSTSTSTLTRCCRVMLDRMRRSRARRVWGGTRREGMRGTGQVWQGVTLHRIPLHCCWYCGHAMWRAGRYAALCMVCLDVHAGCCAATLGCTNYAVLRVHCCACCGVYQLVHIGNVGNKFAPWSTLLQNHTTSCTPHDRHHHATEKAQAYAQGRARV